MLSSGFLVVAVLSAYGEEIRGFGLGLGRTKVLSFMWVLVAGFYLSFCVKLSEWGELQICSRMKCRMLA